MLGIYLSKLSKNRIFLSSSELEAILHFGLFPLLVNLRQNHCTGGDLRIASLSRVLDSNSIELNSQLFWFLFKQARVHFPTMKSPMLKSEL